MGKGNCLSFMDGERVDVVGCCHVCRSVPVFLLRNLRKEEIAR